VSYILKNKDLCLLFIASFLFFFNEMMLMPTLPLYLDDLGYSNLELGMVLGAFALGVLVFRPLAGKVTDRRSRRLSLLIGLTIFIIAPPLYLVNDSFMYLLGVRFFHGIGITFFTTSSPTLIADIAPVHRRGEILGQMSIASTLSMALGPWFGVTLYTHFGMSYALLVSSLVGIVGLVLVLFIHEPIFDRSARKSITYREVIFKRVVVVSSAIVLVEGMIFGGIFTFLPLMLKGERAVNAGLFFLAASAVIVCCRFFVSRFSDTYGRGPMFFYPFLILLLSIVFVAKITTLTVLLVAALLYGIGSALCAPTLTALMADNTEPQDRGRVYSFFYGAFDFGVLSAGVVLGYLADLVGFSLMFLCLAGVGLLAVFIFMVTIKPGCFRSLNWTLRGKGI
jgi:MFS family permease